LIGVAGQIQVAKRFLYQKSINLDFPITKFGKIGDMLSASSGDASSIVGMVALGVA
jgi:hypothetical protein